MKIKEGFILREVAGSYIVVAVGDAVKNFNGIINLNETGAFLWKLAEKGATKEEMVAALLNEYDVAEDVASQDVDAFIKKLKDGNFIK
ncbi:MAG: PqqD family protein [Clostridia bacterium]|nr:PqqD family protein [Clostridia bacterium]